MTSKESSPHEQLPPSTCTGPDENGIKIYIDYKFNDKNQLVKVTRRVKVITITRLVKKGVIERRKWGHFGQAKNTKPGEIDNSVTIYSTDDVFIEPPGKKHEDPSTLMLKNLKQNRIKRNIKNDFSGDKSSNKSNKTTNSYIAPNSRNRENKMGFKPERDNSTTLRVTNLSKNIQEDDVRSLFSQYGKLNRVYLVKDHVTKESRGFAFVSFNLKEEAQSAMDNLRGYGIDHLILKIDWAK